MRTEEWQEKAAFIDKLRDLTERLNRYRAAYASTMSVGLFLVIAILSVFAFRAMQSKGAAYDD